MIFVNTICWFKVIEQRHVVYFKRTLKLMRLTSRYLKFFAWLTTRTRQKWKNRNKELKRLNIFLLKRIEMNNNNTFVKGEKGKAKKNQETNFRVHQDCLFSVFCVILRLNLALCHLYA